MWKQIKNTFIDKNRSHNVSADKEEQEHQGNTKIQMLKSCMVNALPAFLVGTLAVTAIFSYDDSIPQLYGVKTVIDAQAKEETVVDESGDAKTAGMDLSTYEDGIYYGTGIGYGGEVKVAVTILKHEMTQIDIISAANEDTAFFNRAKAVIDTILATQNVEVDTVSGATYSSRGIIEAVKNALTGEESESEVEKEEKEKVEIADQEETGVYKDGTYYGEGKGYDGIIRVKVKIKKSEIKSVKVISYEGDGKWYIDKASKLISNIVKKQTTNVDTISGATYSSRGIIYAVRNALKQAVVDQSDIEDETDDESDDRADSDGTNKDDISIDVTTPEGTYQDGSYVGIGRGYLDGEVKVSVTIKNKMITKIDLISYEYDDEEYMTMAKQVIDLILASQSATVDAVSGATYSSRGIMEAVSNALASAIITSNQQDSNESTNDQNNNQGSADDITSDDTEQDRYTDGAYEGVGFCDLWEDQLRTYSIKVKVKISDGKISAISNLSILDWTGDNDIDFGLDYDYSEKALKVLSKKIIALQTTEGIDTVSGATYSSEAIIKACEEALTLALIEQKQSAAAYLNNGGSL